MRVLTWIVAGWLGIGLVGTARAEVEVGATPKIAWRSVENEAIHSQMLSDKLVVVEFWAAWSKPCMDTMPAMVERFKTWEPKGVVFIGVGMDESRETMMTALLTHSVDWYQVSDFKGWDSELANVWEVDVIPRVFILTPSGEVCWVGHPNKLDAALQEAYESYPPTPESEDVIRRRSDALVSLDEAAAALAIHDYDAALQAMAAIAPEVLGHRSMRQKVGVLLRKVQMTLSQDQTWADTLLANPESAQKLTALSESLASAVRNAEAAVDQPAGPNPQVVAAKFASAQKAHDAGNYADAWDDYDWLARMAAHTDEGQTAATRLAEYEADPAITKSIKVEKAERLAQSTMSLARSYQKAGRDDLAKAQYQKVLDEYPDAERSCVEAKAAIGRLGS